MAERREARSGFCWSAAWSASSFSRRRSRASTIAAHEGVTGARRLASTPALSLTPSQVEHVTWRSRRARPVAVKREVPYCGFRRGRRPVTSPGARPGPRRRPPPGAWRAGRPTSMCTKSMTSCIRSGMGSLPAGRGGTGSACSGVGDQFGEAVQECHELGSLGRGERLVGLALALPQPGPEQGEPLGPLVGEATRTRRSSSGDQRRTTTPFASSMAATSPSPRRRPASSWTPCWTATTASRPVSSMRSTAGAQRPSSPVSRGPDQARAEAGPEPPASVRRGVRVRGGVEAREYRPVRRSARCRRAGRFRWW